MPQWQPMATRLAAATFVVAAMAGAVIEVRDVARADGPLLLNDSHAPAATRATTVSRPPRAPRPVTPTPSSTGLVAYLGALEGMATGTQIIFLDRFEMVQGEPAQVRAFLTFDAEAAPPDPGAAGQEGEFTSGHRIRARLVEDCEAECSLRISSPDWVERRLDVVEPVDSEPAEGILEWTWEVVPLESGRFALTLDIESVAFVDASSESLQSATPVTFERTATVTVDTNPGIEMLGLHTDLGRYTVLIDSADIQNPFTSEVGESFEVTASRSELAAPPRSFQASVELVAGDDSVVQVQRAGPRRGEVEDGARAWSWVVRGLQSGSTDLVLLVDATLDVAGEVVQAHDELAVELEVIGRPAAAVLEEGFEAANWLLAAAVGAATIVAGYMAVRSIRQRRTRPWRMVPAAGSDEEKPDE